MRKNRGLFWGAIFGLAALLLPVLPGALAAAELPGSAEDAAVTQAWMREALDKIEARLTAIEKSQEKILEGQQKLSEEHTQLRYWVHRN